MNVSLTPYLERFVREKVESGRYNSASEVVRASLRLLEEREAEEAAKLEALRDAVREGLGSGPPTPWDPEAFKARAAERLAERKRRAE